MISGGVLRLKAKYTTRLDRHATVCVEAGFFLDAVAISSAESQLLSAFAVSGLIVISIRGG
jgi:hypothetical protein